MTKGRIALAAALLSIGAPRIEAQMGIIGADAAEILAQDATHSLLIREVMADVDAQASAGARRLTPPHPSSAGSGSSTAVELGNMKPTLRRLASSYPEARRQQAFEVFQKLLTGYGQIEQRFGIEHGDTAGSVAAFLAGGVMCFRSMDFPDAYFPSLADQMRGILSGNAKFAQAEPQQKREMYAQLATLGMFLATTHMSLKQRPNAQLEAKSRQAGKDYLERFLGTEAGRIKITAQGLRIE